MSRDVERAAAEAVTGRLRVEDREVVVRELAAELAAARVAEARAVAGLREAARMVVRGGDRQARGVETVAGFARLAGVDRMAVRGWLGIRRRTSEG